MTDTDKLAEPSPKAGGELAEIAEYLIDQRDEPWPQGSESDRLHYWRSKAINAANRLTAIRTPEQPDRNAVLEEAAKVAETWCSERHGWHTPAEHTGDRIAECIRALKEPT